MARQFSVKTLPAESQHSFPSKNDEHGLPPLPTQYTKALDAFWGHIPEVGALLEQIAPYNRNHAAYRSWFTGDMRQYEKFQGYRKPFLILMQAATQDLLNIHHVTLKDATVVDVGCGSGALSEMIPLEVAERVIGIDGNRIGLNHLPAVYKETVETDIAQVNIPPAYQGNADFVFCLSAADTLVTHDKMASNIAALLKPGGRAFFLQDLMPDSDVIMKQYIHLGLVFPIQNQHNTRNYVVMPFDRLEGFLDTMLEWLQKQYAQSKRPSISPNAKNTDPAMIARTLFYYIKDPLIYSSVFPFDGASPPDSAVNRALEKVYKNIHLYFSEIYQEYLETHAYSKKPLKPILIVDPQKNWMTRLQKALRANGLRVVFNDPYGAQMTLPSAQSPYTNLVKANDISMIGGEVSALLNPRVAPGEMKGTFIGYAVVCEKK